MGLEIFVGEGGLGATPMYVHMHLCAHMHMHVHVQCAPKQDVERDLELTQRNWKKDKGISISLSYFCYLQLKMALNQGKCIQNN